MNDWLTPYKLTRPIEPRPCEICGKIVEGSFRYKPTGELAHMSCIINPQPPIVIGHTHEQPPTKDDENPIDTILKAIEARLAEIAVYAKERNDMLRDAYTKEKVQ